MTDHPSRAMLERLAVDDLPAAQKQQAAGHVAGCERCRTYVVALERFAAERLSEVPPAAFTARLEAQQAKAAARPARRPSRWAGLFVAAATAAAAATVAGLWLVPSGEVASPEAIRFKGMALAVHRNRDGQTEVMGSDHALRAGDALRVVVTLDRPQPLAVWFVDATGRVDRFFSARRRLAAGEHSLPGSAIIERPCRQMWLVLATGDAVRATDEAALRAVLVAAAAADVEPALPRGTIARHLRCE